jgi:signal transduction histidine kinase
VGVESSVVQLRLLANERLAAIGALAAAVFHDLRQPLMIATQNAQRIAEMRPTFREFHQVLEAMPPGRVDPDSLELLADLPDMIDEIQTGCESVQALAESIYSLLHGTKKARAGYDPNPRQTIARAMAMTRNVIKVQASATFSYEGPETLPAVELAPTDLLQVLVNLCSNAAQAFDGVSRRDRVVGVRARVSTNGDSSELVVEVSDNGRGMSLEVREQLGTTFFTTRDEGTGLGVPQVMRLVGRARGTVRFDSEVGRGTVVVVTLPLHVHVSEVAST